MVKYCRSVSSYVVPLFPQVIFVYDRTIRVAHQVHLGFLIFDQCLAYVILELDYVASAQEG